MVFCLAFSFVYYSNVTLSDLITSFGADFADIDNKYIFFSVRGSVLFLWVL